MSGAVQSGCALPVALRDRFPWEPVERLVRLKIDRDPDQDIYTCESIGRWLGITRAQVQGYRSRGSVTAAIADTLAASLGLHPSHIWGDAWWDQTIDIDAAEAAAAAARRAADARRADARNAAKRRKRAAARQEKGTAA